MAMRKKMKQGTGRDELYARQLLYLEGDRAMRRKPKFGFSLRGKSKICLQQWEIRSTKFFFSWQS